MPSQPQIISALITGLKESARTHHNVSRYGSSPGLHLSDQHWQYCMAHSCSNAFRTLTYCGVFGQRMIVIRDRRNKQALERSRKAVVARQSRVTR